MVLQTFVTGPYANIEIVGPRDASHDHIAMSTT